MDTVSFAYHTVLEVGLRIEIAAESQLVAMGIEDLELTADCWDTGEES
jgi:hypothetical protein